MKKNNSNKYRSHWHCIYNLKYHLVLVTKYRKKCLSNEILNLLKQICKKQCEIWDIKLLEFGGENDHIHLLLDMHPNILPDKFINSLKTVTSRLVRKQFKNYLSKHYYKPILWTRAYCLTSTGGAPIQIIQKYIKKQSLQK